MTAETAKLAEDDDNIDPLTGEIVKVDKNGRIIHNRGRSSYLKPAVQLALKRELAMRVPNKILAEKYGLSPMGISAFAKRHARAIDDIREHIEDEFAGLPLAQKRNRIAAYEDEVDRLLEDPRANHHEWSKARQMAYRSIAEELGQLPPRQQITVIPVQHVVIGVDPDDLT